MYLIGIIMRNSWFFCLLFGAIFCKGNAQIHIDSAGVITKDTMYLIEEVYISNLKLSPEELEARKQYLILKRRVYKTYPFARTGSERLEVLNRSLAKLKTKKERKRFLKITEDYMENEFEAKLKQLSRKDGQILVKLIHRQTGKTTHELVKNLKSSWSAFWYGQTASIFDIDLKKTFNPHKVREDYLIEQILQEGFTTGMLIEQKSKVPIDYKQLAVQWAETK